MRGDSLILTKIFAYFSSIGKVCARPALGQKNKLQQDKILPFSSERRLTRLRRFVHGRLKGSFPFPGVASFLLTRAKIREPVRLLTLTICCNDGTIKKAGVEMAAESPFQLPCPT